MKLQIDFSSKTIKVLSNTKIGELIKVLKVQFPNDAWKDFTLETNATIVSWYPHYVSPWSVPYYTSLTGTSGTSDSINLTSNWNSITTTSSSAVGSEIVNVEFTTN
jgi:hypothetical protein